MKRIDVLVLVFTSLLLVTGSAAAAQGQDVSPANIQNMDQIQKAIQILENPEQAKKLASQLKMLLDQYRRQMPAPAPQKETGKSLIPSNLFDFFQNLDNRFRATVRNIEAELKSLPLTYQKLKSSLFEKGSFQRLLSIAIKLAFCFLIGLAVWITLHKITLKFKRKSVRAEPSSLRSRIEWASTSFLFKISPMIGFYFSFYLFFWMISMPSVPRALILYELFAIVAYFVIKAFGYYLLSPENESGRIFKLSDETAIYAFIWLRRIFLFSLWMYFLIIPSTIFHRMALSVFLSGVHKVGLIVMAAIILAQCKEGIRSELSLSIQEKEGGWRVQIKKRFNTLIDKLYLIVVIYFGIILVLPVLGFPKAYSYLLGSTALSLLVFAFAFGLWILWNYLLNRLFSIQSNLKQKNPDLEQWVNRYVSFIGTAGRYLIVIMATLAVLDAWGLKSFSFIASQSSLFRPLVQIPLIILVAIFLAHASYFLISQLERRLGSSMLDKGKTSPGEVEKRVATFGRILRKALLIAIFVVAGMMILEEVGFDIKPILAGAGILGLAIGFGAQNLVKDIISGLFLIVENRIRVNDVAIVNGTGGLVEQVNPRTTVLRGLDGTIHVFPNGAITTLSNMTYEYSYYVFNVGVAYKEDTDRVVSVLKEIGDGIMADEDYAASILEPIEILGVDQFGDSAVIIKARIKTVPIKQWYVGREMNRRIKKRFDELGIEIPFPHQSLYFGEASKPIRFTFDGKDENRGELKKMIFEAIKEVMREEAEGDPGASLPRGLRDGKNFPGR